VGFGRQRGRREAQAQIEELQRTLPARAVNVLGTGEDAVKRRELFQRPRADGDDDMYGFMDVTISKSKMKIEAISHSGILRKTVVLEPRRPATTTSITATTTTTTMATATSTTTTSTRP